MVDAHESGDSLCLFKKQPGVEVKDNNMTFSCKLIDDFGLGQTLQTETATVRVYGKSTSIAFLFLIYDIYIFPWIKI